MEELDWAGPSTALIVYSFAKEAEKKGWTSLYEAMPLVKPHHVMRNVLRICLQTGYDVPTNDVFEDIIKHCREDGRHHVLKAITTEYQTYPDEWEFFIYMPF